MERDKLEKSESVGQPFLQLSWKQKRKNLKKLGFLSLNFIKRCSNIHRCVWQLFGVEQIQNGGRCHGNHGANNVKFKPYRGSF